MSCRSNFKFTLPSCQGNAAANRRDRSAARSAWLLVVVSRLQDYQFVTVDEIDQAVFITEGRDQQPANMCRSASGLPIPLLGSRSASSMSRLIRLRVVRSADSQYVESSHPLVVNTSLTG